ncbi:MAG: hypothetical protein WBO44_14675 [Saprospiraceae bacterium]
MFDNIALDIFIGLIFIFLLYSLMASIIQEIIATRFAFRAKVLEKAIIRMLEDGKSTASIPYMDRIDGILHIFNLKSLLKGKTVAALFYVHPLIKYLAEDNWYSKPAYISAENFSKVMIDLLKGIDQPASQSLIVLNNSIANGWVHNIKILNPDMANPAMKHLNKLTDINENETVKLNESTAIFLQSLWLDSGADITEFQAKLEQWFNDTMDRATGWYKKYTRIVLFVIGCALAFSFNVDTIAIKRILSTNEPARNQLVQMAIANKDNLNPDNFKSDNDSILNVTYKMVAKDATDANNIIGLGKPWKDSCKICEAQLGCDPKITAAKIKLDSLLKVKINVNALQLQKDSIKKEMQFIDSLIKAAKFTNISIPVKSQLDTLNKLNRTNDSLLKLCPTQGLSEIDTLSILLTRCPLILKAKNFQYSPNQTGGLETLIGWLITALAITLGAPFWFDLLNKFVSLRGVGTIPKSGDDGTSITKDTATAAVAPINVNVNSNPGDEAVG